MLINKTKFTCSDGKNILINVDSEQPAIHIFPVRSMSTDTPI